MILQKKTKIFIGFIISFIIFILLFLLFLQKFKYNLLWNLIKSDISNTNIIENYLAVGSDRDAGNHFYNTVGMWEATGEQKTNKNYILAKSRPFNLDNRDIKGIFNYNNEPKLSNPRDDFECNNRAIRPLLYSSFKIRPAYSKTIRYLAFENSDILVKKYDYPLFNASIDWSFVPYSQYGNTCVVSIVNNRHDINNLAHHYITAPNSQSVETNLYQAGYGNQYWIIHFDEEKSKENPSKVYFYIESYYFKEKYLTYTEVSAGFEKEQIHLSRDMGPAALWIIDFGC